MVGSKLKVVIKQDIPVVTLFTYPTIQALAQHLGEVETGKGPTKKKPSRSAALKEGKNMMKRAVKRIEGKI